MRPFLSFFLTLHWAIVFALLAFACADGSQGAASILSLLRISADAMALSAFDMLSLTVPLATALLLVSLLFVWGLLEQAVGDASRGSPGFVHIAFAAAAGIVSLLAVVGALHGAAGALSSAAIQMTALAVSYVAIVCERLMLDRQVATPPVAHHVIRSMALGAARSSLMPRQPRGGTPGGKG